MHDAPAGSAWSPETLAVAAGRPPRTPDAPVNAPVELTSTFVASTEPGARGYARFANPTWEALEEVLAFLEDARSTEGSPDGGGARAFASGMAAVSAVIEQVPVGGLVIAPESAYNTTLGLLDHLEANGRLRQRRVPPADTAAVVAALSDTSPGDLLWLESPTNPMLEVADLPALCAAAREAGVRVAVDNTFATPLVQQPLALGADVVVHSVTKYLAGHSDVVMGAVVTRDPGILAAITKHRTVVGAIPGPFEAWLALRGVRTLHLRVERSQASAAELARRLAGHPAVKRVRHPSLPSDPGHARAAAQMRGFGSVLSIEVHGGAAGAQAVQEATRLWLPATSLGGVESLIERRRRHPLEPVVVPEDLLRLSVGIEDVEDLWTDLSQALDAVSAAPASEHRGQQG
ncbi:cystathionine gamma-synthase [Quadrisphaera granulorum]|uniref:homocysteine desulfhydrase n=1 Tax=Quadrisphaera granulorum TaxID=317664 RepID=A0A316AHG1_9ACTN|nr:PLP-dependent aspartate aminotransferase family protein [Quadrisphaera granulorum]PWJ56364.1 cystathionine gamma-synthase [Quadrisphaera granulorum]SZE94998.1 cystathionine gamma-synthase [Quadrisphaera granulorum]